MSVKDYNILLTASGFNDINNYVSDEMRAVFSDISLNKKVMILANAAPVGSGNFIARDNVKDNFYKAGAKQVDIVDLTDNTLDVILNYDILYVIGGDSTPLIELNKNPKFKEAVVQFLKRGIYIGESAGTAILYHDLKWVYEIKHNNKPHKYHLDLPTYKGLGLTDYNIFPHYNKIDEYTKELINECEKKYNIQITRLNDGEYIAIKYMEEEINEDR